MEFHPSFDSLCFWGLLGGGGARSGACHAGSLHPLVCYVPEAYAMHLSEGGGSCMAWHGARMGFTLFDGMKKRG